MYAYFTARRRLMLEYSDGIRPMNVYSTSLGPIHRCCNVSLAIGCSCSKLPWGQVMVDPPQETSFKVSYERRDCGSDAASS